MLRVCEIIFVEYKHNKTGPSGFMDGTHLSLYQLTAVCPTAQLFSYADAAPHCHRDA